MIIDVGNILINKIVDLPWIQKYAGVVKPISYKQKNSKNSFDTKVFPGSCQETFADCEEGKYKSLVPDSSKKSILYLESQGARLQSEDGRSRQKWSATYDLVCWLNMPALGFEGCSYSSQAIMGIMNKLPISPFNSGNYQAVTIKVLGQQPKSTNPFSKYTYDETVNQFLLFPYDYFVLTISVEYWINKACAEIEELGTVAPCLIVRPEKYSYIKDQNGNVVYKLKPGETYNVIVASGIDEGDSTTSYTIQVIDIN